MTEHCETENEILRTQTNFLQCWWAIAEARILSRAPDPRLVNCCVELHSGTVLGTLSLPYLALTKLRKRLGQNSSLKTVRNSKQHQPRQSLEQTPNGQSHTKTLPFSNANLIPQPIKCLLIIRDLFNNVSFADANFQKII